MNTGSMVDRVAILRDTPTADTQGGAAVAPGTLATIWANVRAARAAEQQQAQAVGSHVDYAVTIRYRADVAPSMRLSWTPYQGTAKTLQIIGVHPLNGRREFLMLTCKGVE